MSPFVLLVAALAVVVLPGAAICLAAGAAWRTALAAGPALTSAVVGIACLASVRTDTHWNPVTATLAAVVACCAALLVGTAQRGLEWRFARRRAGGEAGEAGEATAEDEAGADRGPEDRATDADPRPRRRRRWSLPRLRDALPALLVVLLAAVPVAQIAVATRGLTAIPQNWDAIFHGAAARFIATTGLAGPGDLGPVSQPLNPSFFYPNTYHALAALFVDTPGGGLPEILDVLSAVTGAVFVAGVAVLASSLVRTAATTRSGADRGPGTGVVAVAAAAAAAGAWVYPYAVLGRGPLLPFAFGLALLPGVFVLAERVAVGPRRVPHALLLGAALAGAWSVHPSVALAAAVPLVARAVVAVVAPVGSRLATTGAFLVAAVPTVVYVLWHVGEMKADTASMAGFTWPRTQSVPVALASALDLGPTPVASVGLATAALVGLLAALTRRGFRAVVVSPLVAVLGFGTMFVLTRAVEGDWVRVVSSYFWDDSNRFAALLVLPVAVLAGLGVGALVPAGSTRRPAARRGLAAAAVCGLLVASAQPLVAHDLRELGYTDDPAVRAGEREILDDLAARYTGGTVLNDPFDGTSWVYALHGTPVVFPAPLADKPSEQLGPARMDLYTSIDRYGYEPLVTHRVRELDVRWVVVGTGVVGGPGRPPGFVGLHLNPHLRLVAENGDARLYEVLPVPDHPPLAPPPGIPPFVPPGQPANTDSPLVLDSELPPPG